ncbi:MAG: GatB/YqeY domain-containing protein [Alistipes sp.]|nr:GatB/YqeY domain-containing protein [Alistipes sp.]MDY5200324.1 GatB/YqeY domain-containing protein [Candidatus Cryptobacteroides sp.]
MALEQQIQKDIMEAMKAHDEARLNATRGIKSEILLAKTSGAEHELTDADVLKIIQKLVKQRKESAELYTQGNRPELAEKELSEMRVMEAYLPKALSEDEVRNILKEVVAEVGATGPKDMGKVMGAATKRLSGQADGRLISTIVKELLAR